MPPLGRGKGNTDTKKHNKLQAYRGCRPGCNCGNRTDLIGDPRRRGKHLGTGLRSDGPCRLGPTGKARPEAKPDGPGQIHGP
eukprot:13055617-Alexandrium_andersonii.AAC.1